MRYFKCHNYDDTVFQKVFAEVIFTVVLCARCVLVNLDLVAVMYSLTVYI